MSESVGPVAVAMSGGVDSSFACALLVERGYRVFGVTMRLGTEADASAISSARQVTQQLGIPHRVVDLSGRFEEVVVNHFVSEYLHGRTPNPCTVCNPRIKFSALWEAVRSWSPQFMATGHYARRSRDTKTRRYLLSRPRDQDKDQTYMLYRLKQHQLRRAVFPLGEMTKQEVRAAVTDRGLAVADRPESQDICFVQGDYRDFLLSRAGQSIEPGPIVDTGGNVLGQHRGLPFYTVGQRKGLGISAGEPLYVIQMDRQENALVVGPREALLAQGAQLSCLNFIPFDQLESPTEFHVQIRYNAKPTEALVIPHDSGDGAEVRFSEPQAAVTPGQAAVFYRDDLLVGGGTISKSVQ